MSLKNEAQLVDVIEERDGIRALSLTELGWVSGGNGKSKGGNKGGSQGDDKSATETNFLKIASKFPISKTLAVHMKKLPTKMANTSSKLTITFEIKCWW